MFLFQSLACIIFRIQTQTDLTQPLTIIKMQLAKIRDTFYKIIH